jgi:hypothetical protein
MGILSHRVERSEIKAGDHIYTWRAVYAYSHHGDYLFPFLDSTVTLSPIHGLLFLELLGEFQIVSAQCR